MTTIDPTENLSRFILHKDYIRASDNTVKPAAFMPNPKNGETSVFRTSGIEANEIWDIGDREVASKHDKSLLGRADILTINVIKKGLKVIPTETPERHANLVGWPEEKSEQKQIALELAAESRFFRK